MADVKLLTSWGSPFSCRVEIALKLKGLSYERVFEDLSNKSPLLLKYNPIHKKIPVLVHNEQPIIESTIILEYIDETFEGYSLLPEDPYQKAIARFWVKFIEDKVFAAAWKACWSEGAEQETAMEESFVSLKTLEDELKGKKFFGGENIGIVDITANVVAFWIRVIQDATEVKVFDEIKLPILSKWVEDFCNVDVVKESLPDREKLFGYFRSRKEAMAASK